MASVASRLHSAARTFVSEPLQLFGTRWLQRGVGSLLLVRLLTEWSWASLFWGPHGMAVHSRLGWLFQHEATGLVLLGILGLSGLALILGRWTREASLVALLVWTLLSKRLPGLLDAGDDLLGQLLVYVALLYGPRDGRSELRTWLHNVGVVLILVQTGIVYVDSGLQKLATGAWLSGTATYAISQLDVFGPAFLRPYFLNPVFAVATTYGTLLLELAYPVAMRTPLRPLWLLSMLTFHVWTMFGLGYWTFGALMLFLNVFHVRDAEAEVWRVRVRTLRSWVLRSPPVSSRSPQ